MTIAVTQWYELTDEQVQRLIDNMCEDLDSVPAMNYVEDEIMELCASMFADSFEITNSDDNVNEIYNKVKRKIEGDAKRQLKRKITELEKEIAKNRKELKDAQEELWKLGE